PAGSPAASGEPRSRQRRTAWPNSPDVIATTVCAAAGRFLVPAVPGKRAGWLPGPRGGRLAA
ncbi:hypothetical protein, partial [Trebonia sp.]|uniref:hypothetical protein n=1 Tax=Trebonia sp. TaxID=2767075 RepID=UPI003CC62F9D